MRAGHRLVVHQQDLLRRAAAAAQQRGEDLRVGCAVGMRDADRLRLRVADTKADESDGKVVRIGAFMVY